MENGIDTGALTVTSKSGKKIIDNVRIIVPAGKAYALLGKDNKTRRLFMRLAAANLKDAAFCEDEERLFSFMTCKEYLRYGLGGFKTNGQELDERATALLDMVSLARRANRKLKRLKKAEYLCLCAAYSLINGAEKVLLNADTLPCRRKNRKALDRLIYGLKAQGKSALVNPAKKKLCGKSIDAVTEL